MALIKVMNPPHKKRRVRRKKAHFKRRIRVKKHIKRVRVKRLHVKRVRIKQVRRRIKRLVKKRRARRRHSRHHINPFGSEMIMLGNPKRKSRRKSMARKRHRRRHHALTNPFSVKGLLSKPKEMVSKEFVTETVGVAVGFMAPNIVLGYLPVSLRDTQIKMYASKVAVIAGLSVAAGMVSKKASRFVLIGGGVALLMDFWALWRARSVAPAAPAGTSAYYGEDNMSAYYGDNGLGDEVSFSDQETMFS